MKHTTQNLHLSGCLALSIVFALFAFSSCSQGTATTVTPTPTPTPTVSPYFMKGSIDGTSFTRDSCMFYPDLVDSTKVIIHGWTDGLYSPNTSAHYPIIEIHFTHYNGIGTYNFTGSGTWARLYTAATVTNTSNGSITITSAGATVSGTFNFTTNGGIVVSNGSFTAFRD